MQGSIPAGAMMNLIRNYTWTLMGGARAKVIACCYEVTHRKPLLLMWPMKQGVVAQQVEHPTFNREADGFESLQPHPYTVMPWWTENTPIQYSGEP